MTLYGSWMAIGGHHGLKSSKSSLCSGHREPGHPEQYLYIDSWLWLSHDPPPWVRFYFKKGKEKY